MSAYNTTVEHVASLRIRGRQERCARPNGFRLHSIAVQYHAHTVLICIGEAADAHPSITTAEICASYTLDARGDDMGSHGPRATSTMPRWMTTITKEIKKLPPACSFTSPFHIYSGALSFPSKSLLYVHHGRVIRLDPRTIHHTSGQFHFVNTRLETPQFPADCHAIHPVSLRAFQLSSSAFRPPTDVACAPNAFSLTSG